MKIILRPIDDDLESANMEGHGPGLALIAGVAALVPGEADEANWHWILKLKDGRWAYMTAGCDYSGWG